MKVMVRIVSESDAEIKVCQLSKTTSSIQGLFVLALACCCLLSDVSAAPLPAPLIDPLSATIGAAGGIFYTSHTGLFLRTRYLTPQPNTLPISILRIWFLLRWGDSGKQHPSRLPAHWQGAHHQRAPPCKAFLARLLLGKLSQQEFHFIKQ